MTRSPTNQLRARIKAAVGDWPHLECSQAVRAAGMLWHVQMMGRGSDLLLVHGTGASTHSWRDLMPVLAAEFRVIAFDLPAHGFSDSPARARLSMPAMADAIHRLLQALDVEPKIVAGHSAGAAILAQMCLDGGLKPACAISLNGALLPFEGVAGKTYSPFAKLLALNPVLPHLIAWRARRDGRGIDELVASTGSKLDDEAVRFYRQLAGIPQHLAGALGMMSRWELVPLQAAMSKLEVPVLLVIGLMDGLIKPDVGHRAAKLLPKAEILELPELGHVAHEEKPEEIAGIIRKFAQKHGVLIRD